VDVVLFSKERGSESRLGQGLSGKVMKSSVNKSRVKKVSNTNSYLNMITACYCTPLDGRVGRRGAWSQV
jgi:hypothetical protein